MRLRTGVDIVELHRIEKVIDRHGPRFLKRIFTPRELALVGNCIESLATRFAAKEATGKALGCGIGTVSWQDIEVLRDERNAPVLHLHNFAQKESENLGLDTWSISLSHTQSQAIALVVAIGNS